QPQGGPREARVALPGDSRTAWQVEPNAALPCAQQRDGRSSRPRAAEGPPVLHGPGGRPFLFPQPVPDPPQDPPLLQRGEFPDSPHFVYVCEGRAGRRTLPPAWPA
ncbi:unnamed protein product, partial [Gulo gulo]